MSNDRLDPRVDDHAVDPERIILDVTSIAARAAAILGALARAEIPLGLTTFQALGMIHDALSDAIADGDGDE